MSIEILVFSSSGSFIGNETLEMEANELGECVQGHCQEGNIVIFAESEFKDSIPKVLRQPEQYED